MCSQLIPFFLKREEAKNKGIDFPLKKAKKKENH